MHSIKKKINSPAVVLSWTCDETDTHAVHVNLSNAVCCLDGRFYCNSMKTCAQLNCVIVAGVITV